MIPLKLLPVLNVTIWDEALDQSAIQDIRDNNTTLIPEPTSLGHLSLTGLALLCRRRR
ncbi:PEP-CTERM sorting domain-containing protein [Akkermansiaceae bacterium]|nr:PEP-CTERM sorting domain-containing protein [Akkermansiaceae bacterium]